MISALKLFLTFKHPKFSTSTQGCLSYQVIQAISNNKNSDNAEFVRLSLYGCLFASLAFTEFFPYRLINRILGNQISLLNAEVKMQCQKSTASISISYWRSKKSSQTVIQQSIFLGTQTIILCVGVLS